MATRIKTVEYAFQSANTSLAINTRRDLTGITVSIPETTGRTFRSVRMIVGVRDTVTTAATTTTITLGVKIDAVAFSDATVGNPPANTGESAHYLFERDVTSYFTTNFTGTSHTVQCGFQFGPASTGPTTINHTCKLLITYEYDDAASTVLRTVRIPLDTALGALTATLAEVGTNQIPALDTFLPETSKTYRNIFFEISYNEYTTGTANDASLGMQVDSGTEHLTGAHESGLASSESGWYIWDQGASPAWSTGSAHAFKVRSSSITTASTFNHPAIMLVVTYECAASSTTVMNSILVVIPQVQFVSNSAGDETNVTVPIWVEEPATVTLAQSGLWLAYGQQASGSFVAAVGSQTARTYTETALAFGGSCFITHRIDSGALAGSGLSLARGKNNVVIKVRTSATGVCPTGIGGWIVLNYTSGLASGGVATHNHSVAHNVHNSIAAAAANLLAAAQYIYLPETNWFANSLAVQMNYLANINSVAAVAVSVGFEAGSGELSTTDFHYAPVSILENDGELGWSPVFIALQSAPLFDRWSNDPQTERMSLTGSRRWRFATSQSGGTWSALCWLTYHSITFAATGTITGSGGGTVNLCLHDATKHECLATGSRTGNGSYTLTWFDNTQNCYVDAREGATYLGRSDNGTLA
jgi:hypothetical protein